MRIIASKLSTEYRKVELNALIIVLSKFRHGTATIQLNQEEAACYRDVPVVLDFRSGLYIFPVCLFFQSRADPCRLVKLADLLFDVSRTVQPTDDNIVKVAINGSGMVFYPAGNTDKPVSTPRTASSHGDDDGRRVPQSFLRRLRSLLRGIYPALAEKPFTATRLCW